MIDKTISTDSQNIPTQIVDFINRLQHLRQEFISLINLSLQLFEVVGDYENLNVDESYDSLEQGQIFLLNIFSAVMCYSRLLAVLNEIYWAVDKEKYKVIEHRKSLLITDLFASMVFSLKLYYLSLSKYQLVSILNIPIFIIDLMVAFSEWVGLYINHVERVNQFLTSISISYDFSQNTHERIMYLQNAYHQIQSTLEKQQILNLIIAEQKFELESWRIIFNISLCFIILLAFVLLQHYMVLHIPGLVITKEFNRCVAMLIIFAAYHLRDWILDEIVPNDVANSWVVLIEEKRSIKLIHGQELEDKTQEEPCLFQFEFRHLIKPFALVLAVHILLQGGSFGMLLWVSGLMMLLNEFFTKHSNTTEHHLKEPAEVFAFHA